jgi:hypothetical protein
LRIPNPMDVAGQVHQVVVPAYLFGSEYSLKQRTDAIVSPVHRLGVGNGEALHCTGHGGGFRSLRDFGSLGNH